MGTVRQDLDETNTALQQLHEELGEQAEQIEKVEGRMEREVSRHDISLGLGCILLKKDRSDIVVDRRKR